MRVISFFYSVQPRRRHPSGDMMESIHTGFDIHLFIRETFLITNDVVSANKEEESPTLSKDRLIHLLISIQWVITEQ